MTTLLPAFRLGLVATGLVLAGLAQAGRVELPKDCPLSARTSP